MFALSEENIPALTFLPLASKVPAVSVKVVPVPKVILLPVNWNVPPEPLITTLPNVFPPESMVVVPEVPVKERAEVVAEPSVYVMPETILNVTPFPPTVRVTPELCVSVLAYPVIFKD